jgi:carboxymethylenebutenolidase
MTMWNQLQTDAYEGMIAETVLLKGHNGDSVNAYYARPLGPGPFPGVVWVHHAPGWDEYTRECVRRLAQHGYAAIAPNLYSRFGHGATEDVTARMRGAGGNSDANVIGDSAAAQQFLRAQPYASGKVGIIGPCSGGRHATLVACSTQGWDAVVDLWGGRVVQAEITENMPVSPITLTSELTAPLLGIFGNEDRNPSPEQVNSTRRSSRSTGRTTSSTATTAPVTASSPTTALRTGRSRPWTAGARSLLSSASTSRAASRPRRWLPAEGRWLYRRPVGRYSVPSFSPACRATRALPQIENQRESL